MCWKVIDDIFSPNLQRMLCEERCRIAKFIEDIKMMKRDVQ
jgi:hypothetical protein